MALKEQARFLSHYLACKPKKFALALLPVYPITVSVDTHTLFYLLAQIYVTLSLSLFTHNNNSFGYQGNHLQLGPPASEGKSKTCSLLAPPSDLPWKHSLRNPMTEFKSQISRDGRGQSGWAPAFIYFRC